MAEQPRYAIYFSPEREGDLWRFGSSLIGYDAYTGEVLDSIHPDILERDEWRALTSEPRRYGFHATLKAPFRLRSGVPESDLIAQFKTFSASAKSVSIGAMDVRTINAFIAIVPKEDSQNVVRLAAEVVQSFEALRAPLTNEEMERRLKSPLTDNQKRLLVEFGYPYVLEEFRFHMTLTGPAHFETRAAICSALKQRYASEIGSREFQLDRISIYKQATRDDSFRIITSATLR